MSGQEPVAENAGERLPVDFIYIIYNGIPFITNGDTVGDRVDLGGTEMTVPDPYASDRVVVINPDNGKRYSIPREYLGHTLPMQGGGSFVAEQIAED